ncbi:MAG: membrane dipeptidase [Candidatus Azotimanducaceae bacterium]|jgi:membrane dipeptidase
MLIAFKRSFVAFSVMIITACTNATIESEAISLAAAKLIHDKALVLDAHADIEIPGKEDRYAGKDGRSKVEPSKMRAGGVDAVVMAIAVGPGPRTSTGYKQARQIAENELAAILQITSDPSDDVVLVRSAAELDQAHKENKRALILGFQNARIFGNDFSSIDYFYDAGVRVFALTHMGHNDFADSSRPVFSAATGKHEVTEEHGGLSDLGIRAIEKFNQLGAIVDISQLSKAAALQVIAQSKSPVIASHSNVQKLTAVSRNLSDEEIDLIAKKGGVIHVAPFRGYLFDSSNLMLDKQIRAARRDANIKEDFLYPFELYWEIKDPSVQKAFLTSVSDLLGPSSINDVIDHIDYIVQRVGIDHIGIGTDFNHGSGIEGYDDASEALNVTIALLERGYTAQDIEKIWGGNFLRVFREVSQ